MVCGGGGDDSCMVYEGGDGGGGVLALEADDGFLCVDVGGCGITADDCMYV